MLAKSGRSAPVTKLLRYEAEKQRWMMRHPHANVKEYEAFIRELVKRLGL